MPDFSSERFQSSLADTVVWCKMKSVVFDVHSGDTRKLHTLYAQAEQHWEEARKIANRSWLYRTIIKRKHSQRATALLKEIGDLLGPMDRKLRSPELKPSFGCDEFGNDALWVKAVSELVEKRSQWIANISHGKGDPNVGGRLLLYVPSENLACGAAEASSKGFFDVNNVPPWDTWIDFSEGTLVSWVPPALIDVAQMGIDVNPEGCIGWAD